MDLRHLRCFIAVAEELHFARAAERLHIEQSPLSRAIKELEEDLGVRLFDRTTRSTRLTRAGQVFLEHVPRVFSALEQASNSIRAVAAGYQDQLRVALSDGITPPRLSALLAQCRQDDPDIEIRLFEIPLSQQIRGLNDELYDVGFAQSADVGDGIVAEAAWSDPLVVVMPARHPLLVHKRIPLDEVLRYPLVMCDPQSCEGYGLSNIKLFSRVKINIQKPSGDRTPDLLYALRLYLTGDDGANAIHISSSLLKFAAMITSTASGSSGRARLLPV
ncbi:LysR family transcriptional regulator [Halopseudomonas aestusnigri]|jgi:DNA-binding transcriptional LysR family regulator|uniref:LysR family transcriptional regulator n=4 Tax=Pseudomonadaceae TaxID=135621 RepID=UPI001E3F6F8E|nr:LysR family transcriptional regulator [Halopseudomonas aestusnigri]